jgi:hypothetical protein
MSLDMSVLSLCWSLSCLWTWLSYSSLCCLWKCLSDSSLCCLWTYSSVLRQTLQSVCVYSIASCAVFGRVCSAETYAATGQFFFKSSLCCAKRCKAYSSLCCTCTIQEPVLHLDVSIYCTRDFVLHLDVSAYKSFELFWTCLSTRACWCSCACLSTSALWWCDAPARVCLVLTNPVAAPVRVCLQELCDAPGHVGIQESSPRCTCRCALLRCIFRFVSVCFETCMFVSVVSIHVRNTETNRKKYFFGFVKQTETQPKQIEFRFFSVQTENIFCLFRGHPTPLHIHCL